GNGSQHNNTQYPRSRLAFQHGTFAIRGAPPLGLVASSMQTLNPQFAAALRLKRVYAATIAMSGTRLAPSPWRLQGSVPLFAAVFPKNPSVISGTIGHRRAPFQITLVSIRSIIDAACDSITALLRARQCRPPARIYWTWCARPMMPIAIR